MALKKADIDREMETREMFKLQQEIIPDEILGGKLGCGRPAKRNKNEAMIRAFIPPALKRRFGEYCEKNGNTTSGKLRELIFNFMKDKGLL